MIEPLFDDCPREWAFMEEFVPEAQLYWEPPPPNASRSLGLSLYRGRGHFAVLKHFDMQTDSGVRKFEAEISTGLTWRLLGMHSPDYIYDSNGTVAMNFIHGKGLSAYDGTPSLDHEQVTRLFAKLTLCGYTDGTQANFVVGDDANLYIVDAESGFGGFWEDTAHGWDKFGRVIEEYKLPTTLADVAETAHELAGVLWESDEWANAIHWLPDDHRNVFIEGVQNMYNREGFVW